MKKHQIIGIIVIALSAIPALFIVFNTISSKQFNDAYLQENGIYVEYFEYPSYGNIMIRGICWMPEKYKDDTDRTHNAVIIDPGINSKKESQNKKCFELVKNDFFVFVIDKRGHGDSDGLLSMLGTDQFDVIYCIDYIETNYKQVNASEVCLLGLSYGGGAILLAQAIEPRVKTTVAYHPFSNITDFLLDFPIQNIIGNTLDMQWDEKSVLDRSAIYLLNESNTDSLLILQGSEDTTVKVEHSTTIYENCGGETNSEIQLIVRDGLGHGENEGDDDSLKYAMTWILHYYRSPSINLNDLPNEIKLYELQSYTGLASNDLDDLAVYFLVIILLGIWILIYGSMGVPYYSELKRLFKKEEITEDINENSLEFLKNQRNYPNLHLIAWVSVICVSSSFLITILSFIINPSIIIYYLLFGSALNITLIFLFLRYKLPKMLLKDSIVLIEREEVVSFLKVCLWLFSGFILFGIVNNIYAYYLISMPKIPLFTSSYFILIFALTAIFSLDFLVARIFRDRIGILLVILLRFITFTIFILFVPLPSFNLPIDTTLLIWLLAPIIIGLIVVIGKALRPITKNELGVMVLLFAPVITFTIWRFFRFL